ncbi:LamG domain-containing protein, partial [Candidatus Marsarchaeota archaeon]|nr:LamG domain-containing protein [Candidatus Marsarchaeota archaeon]
MARRQRGIGRKVQSAMEYLMTYGWAILIIAVVLATLFSLGITNPLFFEPKAVAGGCQIIRPNGAGTSSLVSIEGGGICSEIPQYVAGFNGVGSYVSSSAQMMPSGASARSAFGWIEITDQNELVDGNRNGVFGYGTVGDLHKNSYKLLEPDVWYFVGFTYNQSSTKITVYLDGQQQVGNLGGELNTPNTGMAYIGKYAYFGQGTIGFISDVQVYNSSLSQSEVDKLYQEGIGGEPIKLNSLIAWWPLNG